MNAGRNITLTGMGVNAALIALKILGGVFGRSRALLADAFHSLSDFISDALVLIGLHFFHKKEDADHPYGHGKIETLVTIALGTILLIAAVRIGIGAAQAIYRGEITVPRRFTIPIAAVSIVSKEILYRLTRRIGKRIGSEAMIANAWHHRSDAMTSIVTLAGVTLAIYVPSLRMLDSYAALLVSFFIIKVAFDILRSSVRKIIDTSPPPDVLRRYSEEIEKVPGVEACHDLMCRYYADKIRMEVHIEVDGDLTVREAHGIVDRVVEGIGSRFDEVSKVLVHIDPYVSKVGRGKTAGD